MLQLRYGDGAMTHHATPAALRPHLPPLSEMLLCLDFDGTLVEIAPTPDAIIVPQGLAETLNTLDAALEGGIALISGRDVATLERFLPGYRGQIWGSHGAEWRDAGGRVHPHPVAESDELADLIEAAEVWSRDHPHLPLEIKSLGVVLHYRAHPEAQSAVEEAAHRLADRNDVWATSPAKMAVEIGPKDAGKGPALQRMAKAFPGRRPVAIGDDTTDEHMFAPALDRGGCAVKVGEGDSAAPLRVAGPPDILALLSALTQEATP
ncbi:MAG: trehalose-phosphatase [Shimia sp.]